VILQAGTCFWRCSYDPPTEFGYLWSPGKALDALAMSLGALPEMHVWAADLDAQEILDFSTGGLVRQAEQVAGLAWTAPRPPRFFWGGPNDLPPGTRYIPARDACAFVRQLFLSQFPVSEERIRV
jgi:hypothetical protein